MNNKTDRPQPKPQTSRPQHPTKATSAADNYPYNTIDRLALLYGFEPLR